MASAVSVESWAHRHEFLLRRLHSLSGVVPIGVFLVEHLYTNSLAAFGPAGEKFNEQVHWLHGMVYLPVLEVLFIFIPLAFHAAYGIVIARTGQANVRHYGYLDNWRYTLQRLTGWIAAAFIVIHLLHYRFAHWFGGPGEFIGTPDPFGYMQWGFGQFLPPAAWYSLYAIGLIASVYHFANGLCTFCITWGITVGDTARKRVAVAAFALGAVLLVWGFMSLWAISSKLSVDQPSDRAAIERHLAESTTCCKTQSEPRPSGSGCGSTACLPRTPNRGVLGLRARLCSACTQCRLT